jgi:hypothetical protein
MTGILQNYLPLVVFIGVASLIGVVLRPSWSRSSSPIRKSSPPMNADSTLLTTPA